MTYKLTGTRIGIGQDVDVAADEEIQDGVVAIGGSLRVEGRLRSGAVVVGGVFDAISAGLNALP